MYTRFFVKQIVHASKKGLGSTVCELGMNSWDPRINKWVKSINPEYHLSETPKEFFKQYGSELRQFQSNPKGTFQTVIAKDILENTWDAVKVLGDVHNITKVGGTIILNLPIGIHHHMSTLSITGVIHIAEQNQYDISYLAISTNDGGYIEKINSGADMNTTKLKDILYKFRETADLRLAVTYKKTIDQEFKI